MIKGDTTVNTSNRVRQSSSHQPEALKHVFPHDYDEQSCDTNFQQSDDTREVKMQAKAHGRPI